MRRVFAFWLLHWLATVAGWYTLSALAQGVVDSAAAASLPLMIFNAVIQLLCFPLLLAAIALLPSLGGFSLLSFVTFAFAAGLNSAVVIALIGALLRSVDKRRSSSGV